MVARVEASGLSHKAAEEILGEAMKQNRKRWKQPAGDD
jgi:hypothetical protein